MKALYIDEGKNTPKVILDPANDEFKFEGKCHPENIRIFFQPIMKWLDEYFDKIKNTDKSLKISFNFEYLNSASYKYLVELIRKLSKFHVNGNAVDITWLYDEEDEDMKESGAELIEMSDIKLPFTLHPYK